MTLVLATPLVALSTARTLERLGIAQKAIQALSLAQRLEGLRAATGRLITPIRKRYGTPMLPTLDVATLDGSGLTGGAVATWSGGPASVVQDYLLTFAASGATYALTTNAGAWAAVPGPSSAWVGSLTIDGYTLALAGNISTSDTYAWSTGIVQDPGIALAVAQVCAYLLLHNRGLDPVTMTDLRKGYEDAMEWAAALGIPGEGELDPSLDTDPTAGGKYGPLGTGQTRADEWIYNDPTYH